MITEYRTETVVQDRFVPLPGYLTEPVEVVERPAWADTILLGALLTSCIVQTKAANGQLLEIKAIEETATRP